MADGNPILTQERKFQNKATAVAIAIAVVSTLALSNGRAMFGPFEQMAAAVDGGPSAASDFPSSAFGVGGPLESRIGGVANRDSTTSSGPVAAQPIISRPGATLPGNASNGPPQTEIDSSSPIDVSDPTSGGVAPSADVPGGGGSFTPGPGTPGGGGPGTAPGGPGTGPGTPGVDPGVPGGPGDPGIPGGPSVPDPVAPVPEPLTWMMMILGLGVIGGVLRRTRSRQTLVRSHVKSLNHAG